jgi:hypothetical protein
MASVVGSHDIHIGKLLAREDETRAAETRGMATVIDGYVCCAVPYYILQYEVHVYCVQLIAVILLQYWCSMCRILSQACMTGAVLRARLQCVARLVH